MWTIHSCISCLLSLIGENLKRAPNYPSVSGSMTGLCCFHPRVFWSGWYRSDSVLDSTVLVPALLLFTWLLSSLVSEQHLNLSHRLAGGVHFLTAPSLSYSPFVAFKLRVILVLIACHLKSCWALCIICCIFLIADINLLFLVDFGEKFTIHYGSFCTDFTRSWISAWGCNDQMFLSTCSEDTL